MGIYAAPQGSDIGSLLRLIQEQEASSLAKAQPQADVSAPMRDIVQEPLKGPESPGTATVVSQRPEGVGMPGLGTTITPNRTSVGPVNIGGPGEMGNPAATRMEDVGNPMPFTVDLPPVDTGGGGDNSKPSTGSASGDWSKYHGNEGVMPEGYHGEGGGQPRNAPQQQSYSAPQQVQPQQAQPNRGVVLGTQIKSGTPDMGADYWNQQAADVGQQAKRQTFENFMDKISYQPPPPTQVDRAINSNVNLSPEQEAKAKAFRQKNKI